MEFPALLVMDKYLYSTQLCKQRSIHKLGKYRMSNMSNLKWKVPIWTTILGHTVTMVHKSSIFFQVFRQCPRYHVAKMSKKIFLNFLFSFLLFYWEMLIVSDGRIFLRTPWIQGNTFLFKTSHVLGGGGGGVRSPLGGVTSGGLYNLRQGYHLRLLTRVSCAYFHSKSETNEKFFFLI